MEADVGADALQSPVRLMATLQTKKNLMPATTRTPEDHPFGPFLGTDYDDDSGVKRLGDTHNRVILLNSAIRRSCQPATAPPLD